MALSHCGRPPDANGAGRACDSPLPGPQEYPAQGALLVVAAQHLAPPVDEVHARASLAGNTLVIVLGRILIVVQPVLDPHPSDRTGEEQCGHRSDIRRFQAAEISR